jgi:hypothetical protein
VTVETAGNSAALVFAAEVNGALFERRGADACTVTVVEAGDSLSDRWEPARFLSGVIGAEEAGAETVNGVASNHYTFDEHAIGASDTAKSTGEMWVASEGGYLVRYVLTTTGGADYFGEGTEGTATWDYALTDIDQPLTVEMPKDCPVGMVDAPLLPDATDVIGELGLLTYSTPASVADVAAFYQEQLPALGWQPPAEPRSDVTSVWLDYTQGDETLTLIVTADQGVTTVTVLLAR